MSDPSPRRWPRVLGIVVACLAVLVVVGVLVLDHVLLSVAKKEAATFSRELGRPIGVEGVATRFWGGLGVKVTGLSVGAAPGEGLPLLELPRAEVRVALLRALFSRGKELRVDEAVVHGLRVNVVKLPGGITNVEALSRQLAARKGPSGQPAQPQQQPQPAQPERPSSPLGLEIGRAAIEDARFAFVDRTTPTARELHVDHVDAEVRDLAVGRPLELVVKAAVLAERQNLELRVKAAPLPPSLVATPEELTLKVEPVDLSPLAPFLPKAVGLSGGRFQADLEAKLGAAVPGGSGPTRLLGGFKASGLAFAGQAGGKHLDASLDTDLTADAKAGDLSIQKLALVVGPAALDGHGRASGLLGDAPRVQDLELTARNLDLATLVEYYPPLGKALGGAVVAGPVGLSLRGEGSAAAQRLTLKLDLTPVRLDVPHQLQKAAGAPLLVTAEASADQGGGRVRFEGTLDLGGVDLRPGGTVAKKPGEPLSVKLAGTYRRSGQALEVALSQLSANVQGDTLSGKGQVALAGSGKSRTTHFDAELSGDRLDLDRLLLPSTEKKAKAAPAVTQQPAGAGALTGVSGEARLRLGAVRAKGAEAKDVVARVKVDEDAVTFEQAKLTAFGGSVDASGTSVHVVRADGPFKAQLHVKGVSAEQALALLSSKRVLSGTLDADLQLAGVGTDRARLEKTANGTLEGHLRDGSFHGKDLIGAVAAPLAGRLPFASKVAEGGQTSLGKDLAFSFRIADGVARLEKPISFDTGQGQVQLSGGVGLDGTLDMPATVALAPALITRMTQGKVRLDSPVPVGVRVVGPASSPRISGLELDAAAKAILANAATGALGKAFGLGGSNPNGSGQGTGKGPQNQGDQTKQLEDTVKNKLKGLFGK